MYTTPTSPSAGNQHKRSWRKHSDEFKARVVALALEPHASMASVALANGINANMLRCWVRAYSPASGPSTVAHDDRNAQALSFVQLPLLANKPLATPPAPATSSVIEVQIQRGETRVVVSLPMISDIEHFFRPAQGCRLPLPDRLASWNRVQCGYPDQPALRSKVGLLMHHRGPPHTLRGCWHGHCAKQA